MYFIYDKKTTEVKMYSQGKNQFSNSNFIEVEYSPTADEIEKIEQNYKLFWKDKLILEKNDWILKDEKKQAIEKLKKDIQGETTVNGLKDKITSLIDLLK